MGPIQNMDKSVVKIKKFTIVLSILCYLKQNKKLFDIMSKFLTINLGETDG